MTPLHLRTSAMLLLLTTGVEAKTTFSQATFVPPGAPPTPSRSRSSNTSPLPSFVFSQQRSATRTVVTDKQNDETTSLLVLHAKKASAAAPSKKIQVKMLKHVKGTGQAGEVVMVTPAYYNNKLRPTKSAEIISDEQVENEREIKAAEETETLKQATELHGMLTAEDFALNIQSKAGPTGQLFGGIGPKAILSELQTAATHPYWEEHSKSIKVTSVSSEGKKMRGDIKHIGEYVAFVALMKDLSAKVTIQVTAES